MLGGYGCGIGLGENPSGMERNGAGWSGMGGRKVGDRGAGRGNRGKGGEREGMRIGREKKVLGGVVDVE